MTSFNKFITLPFSLFIALRYIKPKRTFLSIITFVSVLGVTLGVMVLILVISVMTGFERELIRKVIGFDAHIMITNDAIIQDASLVMEQVKSDARVKAVAPFVQGPVLVEFNHRRLAPKIRGVDPLLEEEVTNIRDLISDGQYDLDGDKTIIGSDLAQVLGAKVGDTITVFSPGNINTILEELDKIEKAGDTTSASELKQMILPKDLEVTGIFKSGRYAYDSEYMLVPLYVGQEIYSLGSGVHGLAVKTINAFEAEDIKHYLNKILPAPLEALTWIDLNKQLFDALRMERNVMFFLLLFIILVAAFGIMNTLITVTVQKTREIGILKALGAHTFQIISVFLFQGVIVGVFGTFIGLILGIVLIQYRNPVSHWLTSTFGIEVFPRSIYQFSEIPAEIVPSDIAIICISAFLICSFAALIPAWFAARLDPVKALRYD